jgi:arylsulfatase
MALEALLLFLLIDFISYKNKMISRLIGGLLLGILYLQALALLLNGRFIQLIMITNIESVSALKGKMLFYTLIILISVIILLLPSNRKLLKIKNNFIKACVITILLFIEFGTISITGVDHSPTISSFLLIHSLIQRGAMDRKISQNINNENSLLLKEFYSESIGDGINKPENISDRPNVILIFTEGMSRNILDDSRNIMPNLSRYAKEGLSFDNYYNHTAATYRGIIGQLYSSHQYNNGDTNSLVSLQSIFKKYGYETIFINTEPENERFTDYLNSFQYDTVTSGNVHNRSLTDKEAYQLLFNELVNTKDKRIPRFITVYTFGTHVTFDSNEKKYGTGDNRLLNRFYNCDYQFGQFIDKLKHSDIGADTVLIFTTDHASYVDEDYTKTFYPEYERFDTFADTVPFIIWYKGIISASVDAKGRNSLDLAPTVLDYLDMDSSNYFLGTSLFQDIKNPLLETVFCVPDSEWYVKTDGMGLRNLTKEEQKSYMAIIEKYLKLTKKTDTPIP